MTTVRRKSQRNTPMSLTLKATNLKMRSMKPITSKSKIITRLLTTFPQKRTTMHIKTFIMKPSMKLTTKSTTRQNLFITSRLMFMQTRTTLLFMHTPNPLEISITPKSAVTNIQRLTIIPKNTKQSTRPIQNRTPMLPRKRTLRRNQFTMRKKSTMSVKKITKKQLRIMNTRKNQSTMKNPFTMKNQSITKRQSITKSQFTMKHTTKKATSNPRQLKQISKTPKKTCLVLSSNFAFSF